MNYSGCKCKIFLTKFSLVLRLQTGLLLIIFSFQKSLQAQETQTWTKENIQFSGYIKYLNTSTFQNLDALVNDNLLHNRLNLKIYISDKFTTAMEVRNRIFWGNSVQFIPDYSKMITTDNQEINLSIRLVDKPALLVHSKIDRLYIDYHSDTWQVTLGRQRINWGKNLAWNPNDLFNTYSFFDFDYEERPGADALRVHYFTSGSSSIETAINYTEKWENNTLAIKYNFNKYNYDFQILAAKYMSDYTLGIGWEGAIKNIGLKGEASYFIPQENTTEEEKVFVGTLSIDYYFTNGITTNLGSLYNSAGITNITNFNPTVLFSYQQSAKNLMPNRFSLFAQISKALTPAVNTSFSTIYAYELQGIYITPKISYNIAQNWDFDLVGQIFYGKQGKTLSSVANSVYLRFRWSF